MRWWNQGTTGAGTGTNEVGSVDTSKSGTPGDPARNAQDENIAKLNMEWKDGKEKLNSLMAKYGAKTYEELEERLAQPPGAQADEGYEDDSEPADDDTEVLAGVQHFAKRNDPVANLVMKMAKRIEDLENKQQATIRATANEFDLRDLPVDERQRVQRHFQRNKHRFGDLKAAYADLEAPKLKSEVQELRDKIALLEKEPNPGIRNAPSTGGGRDTTVDNTPTVSRAEFNRLKHSNDPNDMQRSLAHQKQLRLGKLRITP